ncbi:MAG: dihydrolipoamide acetyltransferase family protein [Firmicutes bacterium]|nr:dihydrolipoamide acetyltransferase family protein [Bacillota bacterium]
MTDFFMPKLGLTMEEARLVRWLKAPGEPVNEGEAFAEIESDKAILELQAPQTGVLLTQRVPEGAVVPVGSVIATFGTVEEALQVQTEAPSSRLQTAEDLAETGPAAAPAVRRRARELGVDLSQVVATGAGGRRITLADVEQAVGPSQSQNASAHREEALVNRQAVAERLTQSARIPQFRVRMDVDAETLITVRSVIDATTGESLGIHLTVTDFVLWAVVHAIRAHPRFQRVWSGSQVVTVPDPRVGLVVATDTGLVIPTLAMFHAVNLLELAGYRHDAVTRARAGRIPQQYAGSAVVSVSNLGMTRVDEFDALLNPGESAILAVGRIAKRPVVREDQLVVRRQFTLTLTCDHRVVDGMDAAHFIETVAQQLESMNWPIGHGGRHDYSR